jgi:hypothetical protein
MVALSMEHGRCSGWAARSRSVGQLAAASRLMVHSPAETDEMIGSPALAGMPANKIRTGTRKIRNAIICLP